MAELTKIAVWMDPRNQVLDGGQVEILPRKEQNFEGCPAHWKALEGTAGTHRKALYIFTVLHGSIHSRFNKSVSEGSRPQRLQWQ